MNARFNPRLSLSATARRSFTATNVFLRKQIWVWPLVAAVLLAAIGWWVYATVEGVMKAGAEEDLKVILNADVAALQVWIKAQESTAAMAAADPAVRGPAMKLVEQASAADVAPLALAQSPARAELAAALAHWREMHGYVGYVVADKRMKIVAAQRDELIGKEALPGYADFLPAVLAGKTIISRPFPSIAVLRDEQGKIRSNVPTMFAAAPLRNDAGEVIGALGLRIKPEVDFTRILNLARAGESGETYAFDGRGLLLSQSRFDDDLKRIRLLDDKPDSHSILTLELRDPGVDMTRGAQPPQRRSEQPLTRMAADATTGGSGVDAQGYRDYRGVRTVGAWTWMPQYGFGIATEQDYDEAYAALRVLRLATWGMFGLLAVSAVAIFLFTVLVARMQQAVRKAALEAKQLGQYTLDEKIGSGGMGVVYRGHHAMLRRPTAIKLLHLEKTTADTIGRFEREVRITSQLSHPNTIAIFDYGHTPEGIFYYAMEYLDGIDLENLVKRHGPQPERRVVRILEQVCGSLAEAHAAGLIHRDIKPANIVINRRGGICDFVKVLDFGLVKAVDSQRETTLTAAGAMTGTPLYMSPEAIQSPDKVDARGDLYAVGAVGYFLLTGAPVFKGESLIEICTKQVSETPQAPSERLGRPISAGLEAIILRCLAKAADDRPATAKEIAAALAGCETAADWSDADAENWWRSERDRKDVDVSQTMAHAPDTKVPDATMIFTGERRQ
ncbi:MAG: serine/threonine protein kinase [Planctomycetia bacterium]|nr:serine/threonine protein kinase [Planctomycetia bacterium]